MFKFICYPLYDLSFSILTINIAVAMKVVGISKVRQTFSKIFAMRYSDIED